MISQTSSTVSMSLGDSAAAEPSLSIRSSGPKSFSFVTLPANGKHILLRNAIWSVSAEVQKLVEAADFDPNVFVPPANATSSGWCPKPADKDQTSQATPLRACQSSVFLCC